MLVRYRIVYHVFQGDQFHIDTVKWSRKGCNSYLSLRRPHIGLERQLKMGK